jgi:hypothetical protein
MPDYIGPLFRILFCVALFIGGYVYRGDCAKEVRASENVASAKAEVKAEQIATKYEVKIVQRQAVRGKIAAAIEALPSPAPAADVPRECPAPALSDDEFRLWNSSNQGRYLEVQPRGVDGTGTGGVAPAGDEGHEGGN